MVGISFRAFSSLHCSIKTCSITRLQAKAFLRLLTKVKQRFLTGAAKVQRPVEQEKLSLHLKVQKHGTLYDIRIDWKIKVLNQMFILSFLFTKERMTPHLNKKARNV